MNFVICSESCRHQRDGYCMLDDLTHAGASVTARCIYYEPYGDR